MEVKIPESVTIVELEKAPFKCAREAIAYAKSHGIVGVMSAADSGGKGEVAISVRSLDKMLSGTAVRKSVTPAIHFSALVRLRDIIRESFVAEVHPDYAKGPDGKRSPANGINERVAMANVRQEVEDAVRDGRKDCCDAKGNLVCRYSIEQK